MGEQAVCLTLNLGDEARSRAELKRSFESIADESEESNSNKKLARDLLKNDRVEVEIDISNNTIAVEEELKLSSECSVDNIVEESITGDKSVRVGVGAPYTKPDMDSLQEENCSRVELKRLHECVTDDTEVENIINKKPAIEEASDNDNTSKIGLDCLNECVVHAIEVETRDRVPSKESSDNESLCGVESKCLDERGGNGNESFCRVESTCMDERGGNRLEVETPENNAVRDSSTAYSLEIPNLGAFPAENASSSRTPSHESVVEETGVENSNEKNVVEPSDDENSCRTGLKCSDERVLDAMEVETADETLTKQSSDVESSSRVESNCSKECGVLRSEVETPDQNPESLNVSSSEGLNLNTQLQKSASSSQTGSDDCEVVHTQTEFQNTMPRVESSTGANISENLNEKHVVEPSDDENSCRIGLNCADECVLDAMEVETADETLQKQSSDDEVSSRVESNCSKECGVARSEVETPDQNPESLNAPSLDGLNLTTQFQKNASRSQTGSDDCEVVHTDTEFENSKPRVESSTSANTSENSNKKHAIGSSDDENSCRIGLKCADKCVLDAMEVETADETLPKKSSDDESSSRVESNCLKRCGVARSEIETPDQNPESLNVSSLTINTQLQKNASSIQSGSDDCEVDHTETEFQNIKPTVESSIGANTSKVELKCSNECFADTVEAKTLDELEVKCLNESGVAAMEAVTPVKNLLEESSTELSSETLNLNASSLENASSNQIDSRECILDDAEMENQNKKPALKFSNPDSSSTEDLKCSSVSGVDAVEVETPHKTPAEESLLGENLSRIESKCLNECIINGAGVETLDKKLPTESSTNSCSGVLNLNVSPQENASSNHSGLREPVEESLRSNCGDIVSSGGGVSSAEIADKDGHCSKDLSTSVSNSEVILEGSKDACGVKKLIVKLRNQPSGMDVDNGFSYNRLPKESKMNPLEKKMSLLRNYTKNVKKMLSTGVLEGVGVEYINQKNCIIRGIIKDCGYLCGCASCSFSQTQVLNAHEFEQHAGCKSKHPNDHIYLGNGMSLHKIIQEMRTTPVSLLEGKLRALVGPLFNEKSYLEWKETLETGNFQRHGKKGENEKHSQLNLVNVSQSTMSSSSEETEDTMMHQIPVQEISTVQHVSNGRKLDQRSNSIRAPVGRNKKRLLFMPNGLPNGSELAYYSKGQKLLVGYKQGIGILCSCCNNEVSPSQFEAHAGCAAKRQPYRHIYTSNGVSLHDYALSLANSESQATNNVSNICTVCKEDGDLNVCDACSRAYHAACLELQSIPEGEWRCPTCKDKAGTNKKVASNESSDAPRPITIRLTRVVKAPATEQGGCVICRAPDFSVLKFDERTVIFCDQCAKEYHIGCLRKTGWCDLKNVPKGNWFCRESCSLVHATLQNLLSTGAKVIPPSMLNKINKKLTEKGLNIDGKDDVQWQVLNGKLGQLEHRPLLSRAITIFHHSFDPILADNIDLIPEMVYGRTVGEQEFGGLYCAVIRVKSVVVSAGLFRIFGRELAELPLVATTKESQGKGYFQALLLCLEKLLCFLNVEKLVLPAAEGAESIWTSKFGFTRMSGEQLRKYEKDYQVISFMKTTMLEKPLKSQCPKN